MQPSTGGARQAAEGEKLGVDLAGEETVTEVGSWVAANGGLRDVVLPVDQGLNSSWVTLAVAEARFLGG